MIAPKLPSTHELVVIAKSDPKTNYLFGDFCTKISGNGIKLGVYPPFDHVGLYKVGIRPREVINFSIGDVDFFLKELS